MTTDSLRSEAPTQKVGFVGLGTMGAAMAANLARAGFPLTVWNRTPGRAEPLLALGAVEAASPRRGRARKRCRRHLCDRFAPGRGGRFRT